MSIQSDRWVRELAINPRRIEPSSGSRVRGGGGVPCGLSSFGYNLRVSNKSRIFANMNSVLIDRKAFDERSFVSVRANSGIVSPNSFGLDRSTEFFRIPRDVLTICVGKRTYARCGVPWKRDAIRAEVGGVRNTENLQHLHAGQGICQRRTVPDSMIPH
jgi:dCTP deaminase